MRPIHAANLVTPTFALAAFLMVASNDAQGQRPLSVLPVQRSLEAARQTNTSAVQPEEWGIGGYHTLRLQKTKMDMPGAARDGGPQEVELLTYNGRLVGPTIRVRRGTTFKVKLVNQLPASGEPPVAVAPDQEDKPHGMYTTNLHTHGLHVSPEGKGDDVFREIAPGQSFEYTFTVPPDHPCGTFWYHPHKHGSVAYQLTNGLAGALIVEGDPSGKVQTIETIPEVAKAKDRVFVLQQFIMEKDAQGVGRIDPNDIYNDPSPNAYQVTAINGVVMPTYHLQPGEVQRWRVIHAGREDVITLIWVDGNGEIITNIPFHEIAIDGLATGTMTARTEIELYPAYRRDLLVQAPTEAGTYYLAAKEQLPSKSLRKVKIARNYLARVVIGGVKRDMELPAAQQFVGCRPFEPIAAAASPVKRDLLFDFDDVDKLYHINGISFSKQGQVPAPVLGSAEEWTLASTSYHHPFHIHVNPFQVVQIEDVKTGGITPMDEWHDTFIVEEGKKVTIRTKFLDFAGKTVLHCHILDHEDQGMMGTIQIVDPARPGGGGAAPAAGLSDCSLPAPALGLQTVHTMPDHPAALRPGNVVLVFFLGLECPHCTRELRGLLREARDLAGTGTTIVAVSSAPIVDPRAAVKSLQIPPGVGFQLLADDHLRGFRAFGCYDGGPLHGLFVIDKAGTIRARYVGDVPFGNAKAVSACVRKLLAANPKGSTPK